MKKGSIEVFVDNERKLQQFVFVDKDTEHKKHSNGDEKILKRDKVVL